MALENGSDMVMPVAPMYGGGYGNGGFGFGNDGGWWIILFLFALMGNSFGFGGFGGGMGMMDGILPYFYNTQTQNDVNRGFDNAGISNQLSGIQSAITSGFGDTALGIAGINQNICSTGAGITSAVSNGFAQAEIANNARQIANMQQAFNSQTAITAGMNDLAMGLQNSSCENRAATADLKYTVANEACNTRFADASNTRDIIEAINIKTQGIQDKLCQLELDGVKAQLAQAERDNVGLQNQLNMASFRESQTAQNAFFAQGMNAEVDALYNRLKNCPVPSQPVYGSQPIFTCNGGCNGGCPCNGAF